MKKLFLLAVLTTPLLHSLKAQNVGVGTAAPNASAKVDISDANRGILIPRVSLVDVTNGTTPVNVPATSLLVYNTNASVTGGSGTGFYYWNGTVWVSLVSGTVSNDWTILGNAGTNPATHFIGTTDNQGLAFRTNNISYMTLRTDGGLELSDGDRNIIVGPSAGLALTSGVGNVLVGVQTGGALTTGVSNVALGDSAMMIATVSPNNIAIGAGALQSVVAGSGGNVAIGHQTLTALNVGANLADHNTAIGRQSQQYANDTWGNTAIGYRSLRNNLTGDENTALGMGAMEYGSGSFGATAVGRYALARDSFSYRSVAIGYAALYNQAFSNGATGWNSYNTAVGAYSQYSTNPTSTANGIGNTSLGYLTLYDNTTGVSNTAIGTSALSNNSTGSDNTAVGRLTMVANSIGSSNTAVGYQSLYFNTTSGFNTALGTRSLYSQSWTNGGSAYSTFNTALGYEALYTNQPTSTGNGRLNTATGTHAMRYNTTGSYNVANGGYALHRNTTGIANTAVGYLTGYQTTTGDYNTALGYYALSDTLTGDNNTALGRESMRDAQSAAGNLAAGYRSLAGNQTGFDNVALGTGAMEFGTSSNYCVAVGRFALADDNNSNYTTAVGYQALRNQSFTNGGTNWSGRNTAIGAFSLYSADPTTVTNGNDNTGLGYAAMYTMTTGIQNVAVGSQAMYQNATGSSNVAVGTGALFSTLTADGNTALGHQAGDDYNHGNDNTFMGRDADATVAALTNATAIGARAAVSTSNALVLGSISGLNGASANTNVGIGTASPMARLDVRGDAVFNEDGGNFDFRIEGDAEANLFFTDASADRVGVGTSTPGARLEVSANSTTGVGGATMRLHENENDYARLEFGNNQTANRWHIAGYANAVNTSERLNFWNSTSGDVLSLRGDGNVGIGTINPGYSLTLNSSTQYGTYMIHGYAGAATAVGLYNYTNGASTGERRAYTGYVDQPTTATGNLTGLYNTTWGSSASGNKYGVQNYLQSTGSPNGLYYGIYNYVSSPSSQTSNGYGMYSYINRGSTSGTTYGVYSYPLGGAAQWAFYGIGDAFLSGGTWQTSDERLKRNITPIEEGALDKLSALQASSYEFRVDNNALGLPAGTQYGLLAQNLEEQFPGLVKEVENPLFETVTAEDGSASREQTGTETFKAVNYSGLIPVLVKAVQELSAQNTELKLRIEDLENR